MSTLTESLRRDVDGDLNAISSAFDKLGTQFNKFENTFKNSVEKNVGQSGVFKKLQKDAAEFKAGLSKAFLGLDEDVSKGIGSLGQAIKGFKSTSVTVREAGTNVEKFTEGLLGATGATGSLVGGLLGLAGAAATLGTIATLGLAAFDSFRELQGVSRTLTFSEAILGSDKLAQNFELVSATGGNVIDLFQLLTGAAINSEGFTNFSKQGISAFSNVETAAFRLNTILVQGSERSIDKIDSTIKSMRELQKATNFAVDSVTLLNTQYDIASGGFTSQRALEQVGTAGTNLATAGFGDQIQSTNALVKVQRALGESADTAEKRAAQLFETTKVGITTLPELSGQIGPLAAQAKSLGIDFAEVAAALATLTTQGLGTSEATTALSSLLEELAANSDQAKQALSGFTDESGRAIQIGAGQLKELGLGGVLKGIQDATKGQLPQLQKVFSSSTAQTGAQLLLNAGTDTLSKNTQQIQNVDSGKLAEEAADRATTLQGAFDQAFNKSQVQVEDFGQAIKVSVIERLNDTNTLLGSVGSGSASFLGSAAGTVDLLSDKLSAIGGFIGTAFNVLVPTVFFNLLLSNAGKIGPALKKGFEQATGLEANFGNILKGIEIIAQKTFNKFVEIVKFSFDQAKIAVKKFVIETQLELKKLENPIDININTSDRLDVPTKSASPDVQPLKQLPAAGNKSTTQTIDVPDINVPELPKLKAEVDGSLAVRGLQEVTESSLVAKGAIVSTSAAGTSSMQLLGAESVKTAAKTSLIGKLGGAALSGLATLLKTSLISLGAFAAAGVIAAGAFQVLGGWVSVFAQTLNEKANPGIQEMLSSLKELEGNASIQKFVDEVENSSTKLEESNLALAIAGDLVTRLQGTWNTVIGSVASYEIFLQRSLEVQDLLRNSIEKTQEAAGQNRFVGNTTESRTAQQKLDRGLELTGTDTNALQKETDQEILEIKQLIAQKQLQINQYQEKGGKDAAVTERLNEELKILQQQGTEQEKLLRARLGRVKAEQTISRFTGLDTTIPLNIQLNQQTLRQVDGEINFLTEKFADAFSSENIDPDALNEIFPQLQSALGAINVQVAVDPQAAVKSLQDIQQIPNFDKLLFGDLNFRKTFSEAFAGVTDAAVASAVNLETAYNASLQNVVTSFQNVPELDILVNEGSIKSINLQVAALTAELNNQATPYARQVELLAQIEQLEAKRVESATNANIGQELDVRQQVLSITESILIAEQARVALLSKEDGFATGLVTAAKARTQAAETELAIRREQLSITAKEEQVRKQQGIQGLQAKLDRSRNTSLNQNQPATSGIAASADPAIAQATAALDTQKTQVDSIKSTYSQQVTKIEETYNRQKALIEETYRKQQEVIDAEEADIKGQLDEKTLSTSQQNTIANELKKLVETSGFIGEAEFNRIDSGLAKDVLSGNDAQRREALFDESGKVRENVDILKIVDQISQAANRDGSARTNIQDVFNQATIDRFNELGGNLNRSANQRTAAESQRQSSLTSLEQTTNSQREAALQKQAEEAQLQAALEAAKKDLELSSALSNAKIALETFANVVALSEARIEEEFATREKSIKQNSLLADSFSRIASSQTFSGSSTGIDLQGVALELSNPLAVVVKDAEKAFAQLNAKIEIQEQALSDAKQALSQAQAAGASREQLAPLKERVRKEEEVLSTARQEVPFDQAFILIKTAADKVGASLQIAEQKLLEEFAARDKVIKQSEQLASSFSNLASNASSLFSSSAVGASLNRLSTESSNPELRARVATQRELAEVDIRRDSLRQLATEAEDAVKRGIQLGLPEEALNKLVENRDSAVARSTRADGSAEEDKALIRQRGVLDTLSASLEVFNSKVQEVNAVLTAQGDIFKDTIDLFVQSQKDIAESNDAIRGADRSFLSLFGSNNPFADILQRRSEASNIREDTAVGQTEAIATAQQEFIDLSILDQQLSLEQQGYENALTQTQLLSDIVRVSQGQEARFTGSGGQADDFLNRLPEIFEQNAQLTDRRREITQERLSRVQPRLEQELQNTRLEGAAGLLNNATNSGDPRLIEEALSAFRQAREGLSLRQVEDPSRRNLSQEFQNITNSFAQTRDALLNNSNRASQGSTRANAQVNQSPSIVLNAQVPITISNTGTGVRQNNIGEIQNTVNAALNQGLNQIAQRVSRK